jgi:hypothetical protein
MPSAYTQIVFTNAVPGGITAAKLNLLRDDLSAAIAAGGSGGGVFSPRAFQFVDAGVIDSHAKSP